MTEKKGWKQFQLTIDIPGFGPKAEDQVGHKKTNPRAPITREQIQQLAKNKGTTWSRGGGQDRAAGEDK